MQVAYARSILIMIQKSKHSTVLISNALKFIALVIKTALFTFFIKIGSLHASCIKYLVKYYMNKSYLNFLINK